MFFTPLTIIIPLVLVASPTLSQVTTAQAPIIYDAAHNLTVITGTWASGARNVVTGSGFADPQNKTFTYPKTTGVSYSFTDDGWYEIARYRWVSNATTPTCITGVVNWVHGHYQLMPNGSIVMTPNGDGYQQIQDPCGAVSNFVENYNLTELYQSWQIFQDPIDGYKLHLFQFDGSPIAPQFQVSVTPVMLPTTQIRNVTVPTTTPTTTIATRKRDLEASGSHSRWSVGTAMAVGTVLFGAAAGVTLLL
jgi:hypothetical protein